MEIRAKCKLDFDSTKALTHLSFYKKTNPKKAVRLREIFCFILLFVIIAELIVFGFDSALSNLIYVDLFMIALNLYMYFVIPKSRYRALEKMKDIENNYLFKDNVLKVSSKSEEYSGEAEIEYSLFIKVYETSAYFFLFQTNNQAFIIDKLTIEGGSADDIRNKLTSFVKNKYFICRY